jgi:hypothetical protein
MLLGSNHRIDAREKQNASGAFRWGETETLETAVEMKSTEALDKEYPSWHEQKERLREMYEFSVGFNLETGLSSAFYIFDISGEPTLGKLSLQEYTAKHGYEEAALWTHENILEKPYCLIDHVGGDFTQEADAFENAWRSRKHFHESRDGVYA